MAFAILSLLLTIRFFALVPKMFMITPSFLITNLGMIINGNVVVGSIFVISGI